MKSTPALAESGATRKFAQAMIHARKLHAGAYRPLGSTGLETSVLGFGSYRAEDTAQEHRRALQKALAAGINLIDTSSNYTDGGSERLIGTVLTGRDFRDPSPERRRLIVVSKVGYVQGQNMALAKEAQHEGHPFADMVEYHAQCWHCIHPVFIRDQLERSLERLQQTALDVYLLHNPEYFFTDWVHRHPGGDIAEARTEFYRRIGLAFQTLEELAAERLIQWYGVSSNTFGHAENQPEFVSLERLAALAEQAAATVQGNAARSRFAAVQAPLNLLEGGPALTRNQQSNSRTFLELAADLKLGVLVNRPLNAIRAGRLLRLADQAQSGTLEQVREMRDQTLATLAQHEQEFARRFRPQVAAHLPPDAEPLDPFNWAQAFRRIYPELESAEHWYQLLHGRTFPQIQTNAHAVAKALGGDGVRKQFEAWFARYAKIVESAVDAVLDGLKSLEHDRTSKLRSRVLPLLPAAWKERPLSQVALAVAAGAPAVSCVLNGMRREAYVSDSMGLLELEPLSQDVCVEILRQLAQEA